MTFEPTSAAFVRGQEAFAGRVLSGPWQGHYVVVLTYLNRSWFRRKTVNGYLVQFFQPSASDESDAKFSCASQEDPVGKEEDYTVDSVEELQESLAENEITWIPWAELDDFIRQYVPELLPRNR